MWINQLTKVIYLGLIDYGIRVKGIGPGAIMTGLMMRVAEAKETMDAILRCTGRTCWIN